MSVTCHRGDRKKKYGSDSLNLTWHPLADPTRPLRSRSNPYNKPGIFTSGFRSQEERMSQSLSFPMAISAMQSPGWLPWPVSCGTWLL